ncbi:MAG: DUF2779 domain-containing protein [Campylobacterota bacterium]|nr:DUF2779 domain-containing protein [Campylobacterota bacterium]
MEEESTSFMGWSIKKYATYFQVRNEEHNLIMLLKYSFLIDFFSLSIAFIVAFFSVDMFVSFFNIPIEYTGLVTIMAISILFRVFEISTGIFRLFDEFKIQSKILVYVAIIKFIFFGIITLTNPTFENFIYATIFSQFIAFAMKLYYSKQILNNNGYNIKDIVSETINHKLIKELKIFSFIVYNNFDVAVRMVSRQLDIVVLGKLYGAEVVGIYRIAKEIAGIIAKLTDPIYQAIYPEFAKLLANGKKLEAKQVAIKISKYAGLAGLGFYAIPQLQNQKPYQQICFQYSLHIEYENKPLEHKEFLAKEGTDPREEFIKHMIADIPSGKCVLVYNESFEKTRIKELARDFPQYEKELLNINENIVDLAEPFRSKDYYDYTFKGKYSIKLVMPLMAPHMADAYKKLKLVQNGGDAMNTFPKLMDMGKEKKKEYKEALLKYCHLDTLAMVEIFKKLKESVK